MKHTNQNEALSKSGKNYENLAKKSHRGVVICNFLL
jgi:hypothetical protein